MRQEASYLYYRPKQASRLALYVFLLSAIAICIVFVGPCQGQDERMHTFSAVTESSEDDYDITMYRDLEGLNQTTSEAPSTSPTTIGSDGALTTAEPTGAPSDSPSSSRPSAHPTSSSPSSVPSSRPSTSIPSNNPTTSTPTQVPSKHPTTSSPTVNPTESPITSLPTLSPSTPKPSAIPSKGPTTATPSNNPTFSEPTASPSRTPSTSAPSRAPSRAPSSSAPTVTPSDSPSTSHPSASPSHQPTTAEPTRVPSRSPSTSVPSQKPTSNPWTSEPTFSPSTSNPTYSPSKQPTSSEPTKSPSKAPSTSLPTQDPTRSPTTSEPTLSPSTSIPTHSPSKQPTSSEPTKSPSKAPSTSLPTRDPTMSPSTSSPSKTPSKAPSKAPSKTPSQAPTTSLPTHSPSKVPTTSLPTTSPSKTPSTSMPSLSPTRMPTNSPSTPAPSLSPSVPTQIPTGGPTTSGPSSTPTKSPTTSRPTKAPTTSKPSKVPTTSRPSKAPTTSRPSKVPTTSRPTKTPSSAPTRVTSAPTFKTKPNVLMIIVDDLKPLLSSYNLPYTDNLPNFNSLSQRGVTFMNAHSQMALCGPSRASFLTSLRPDKLQIYNLNSNVLSTRIQESQKSGQGKIETLPEWFKKNGYATYGAGKVFHENEYTLYTSPAAWTEPVYTWMDKFSRPPSFKKPYQGSWVDFPEVEDDFFTDAQLANLSAALITDKLAKLDVPWFFAVGFFKPHLPWQCPKKYLDFSANQTVPAMGNPYMPGFNPFWLGVAKGGACGEVKDYTGITSGVLSNKSPEKTRDMAVRGYRATIAYVDVQLGKVLDALEASNQTWNTHIVMMGDHGFHLGDKGMYCKHTNFEQAVRAPLVIIPALQDTRWDASRGKRSYAPVELLDVTPTLAEMAGLPTKYPGQPQAGSYGWQGKSLIPILQDPENGYIMPFALAQFPRGMGSSKKMGYTVRTTRYRVTTWCPAPFKISASCYYEMYDFLSDPTESSNLAYKAAYVPIRQRIISIWTDAQTFNRQRNLVNTKAKQQAKKRRRRGLAIDEAEVPGNDEEERDLATTSSDPTNDPPFDFADRVALSQTGKQPFP